VYFGGGCTVTFYCIFRPLEKFKRPFWSFKTP